MTPQEIFTEAVAQRLRLVRFEHQMNLQSRVWFRDLEARVLAVARSGRAPLRMQVEIRRLVNEAFDRYIADAAENLDGMAQTVNQSERFILGMAAAAGGIRWRSSTHLGLTPAEHWRRMEQSATYWAISRARLVAANDDAGPLVGNRGLAATFTRNAASINRTLVTGVSTWVREQVWAINNDIDRVQWVSVLDGKTSDICRSRDGKIYPKGEGPRPPAHFRCRSIVIPLLRGLPPPERESYAEFMARMRREGRVDVIEEALGATRARLYVDGKVPLGRFVDNAGLRYSLEQLRRRTPGI